MYLPEPNLINESPLENYVTVSVYFWNIDSGNITYFVNCVSAIGVVSDAIHDTVDMP